MKTQEELNTIKKEVEILTNKLKELSEEELAHVTGGNSPDFDVNNEQVFPQKNRQECPYCYGTSVNYKLDLATFYYKCHCNNSKCGKDYYAE